MLFYRRENAEAALQPLRIVAANVFFNHLHKALTVSKPFAVIPFPLENPPEALHRAVVDAVSHSGYTHLPSYDWQDISGFAPDEVANYQKIIELRHGDL